MALDIACCKSVSRVLMSGGVACKRRSTTTRSELNSSTHSCANTSHIVAECQATTGSRHLLFECQVSHLDNIRVRRGFLGTFCQVAHTSAHMVLHQIIHHTAQDTPRTRATTRNLRAYLDGLEMAYLLHGSRHKRPSNDGISQLGIGF